MSEIEIIAAIGIFFGCLSRAVMPFLRKKSTAVKAGQDIKWEHRYTWALILDLFIAMIATMFLLPTFQIPLEFVFPNAFLFGWASQDIVNKVAK